MRLIAHRGNIVGPKTDLENNPKYIEEALSLGFDAETDLWFLEDEQKFYLGHDFPQHSINIEWLESNSKYLWVHCKNNDAIFQMSKNRNINFFWHQNDDYTITSAGYIWAYPGQQVNSESIMVLPERFYEISKFDLSKVGAFGICSDFVADFKDYK